MFRQDSRPHDRALATSRAHDEAALCAIITALPRFLKERVEQGCSVKLLLVDSMAFHYRVSQAKSQPHHRALLFAYARLMILPMSNVFP
jgi:hypothetical protein